MRIDLTQIKKDDKKNHLAMKASPPVWLVRADRAKLERGDYISFDLRTVFYSILNQFSSPTGLIGSEAFHPGAVFGLNDH